MRSLSTFTRLNPSYIGQWGYQARCMSISGMG